MELKVGLGKSKFNLLLGQERGEFIIAPGIKLQMTCKPAFQGYVILEMSLHSTHETIAQDTLAHFAREHMQDGRWVSVSQWALPAGTKSFLANGYQCWTESKFIDKKSILKRESHDPQRYFGDDSIWSYAETPGHGHAWSFTILEQENYNSFMGSLTEDRSFAVFDINLHAQSANLYIDIEGFDFSATGQEFRSEKGLLLAAWLLPTADAKEGYSLIEVARKWFDLVKEYQSIPGSRGKTLATELPVLGYTSWYNKFTEIDEDWLLRHIASVKRLTNWHVFQIDDGYQKKVGDWLIPSQGFPRGIEPVIKQARESQLLPGLWLAPFVAMFDSKIVTDHPEWVVRKDGKPVVAGDFAHWGGKFLVMDTENHDYRLYIEQVVKRFAEMGVKFIKADFLYAAAMLPRLGKTRAQLSSYAHQWFFSLCTKYDIAFLSCGAPLASAYGRCDFARIGPDLSLDWEFTPLKGTFSREKPSVKSAMINTVTRAILNNNCFLNDPDVVILRSENTSLSLSEKRNLTLINRAFGGLLFSSDTPDLYGPEEQNLLIEMENGVSLEEIKRIEVVSCEPIDMRIHSNSGVWQLKLSESSSVEYSKSPEAKSKT